MGAGADAMSPVDEPADVLPPAPAADASYDASGKSPDEIEQDIAETRGQLGEILDALERQLAPRHLLEKGVDMLKNTMSGEDSGLTETLRQHPVPLALVGLGVGWMAVSLTTGRGGRLGERVSGALHDAGQRAGALAGQVRDKVTGSAASAAQSTSVPYPTESAGYAYARQKSGQTMSETRGAAQDAMRRAQQAGSAAWEQASAYAGKAGATLQGTGDRLSRVIDEHPIAVGALAVLAGAVIAALLPRTEAEERFVGPAGERLRDSAADFGREAADRAQQVAERTVDAAVDAVREAVGESGEAPPPETRPPV
jgi:hypothetical protein